ncbi:MAG: aminopeptidase P family N-terminal domain-containing protein, partial [Alphaproteobacteria bacterium]|nr:aminopeptidase P family N-terminal domain-containing protein [Alphaproteobacteria bacterium]
MSDNINLLRAEMLKHKIDGFVVPHDDEFCNEFVPSFAERLAHITGFKGSAGIAVVLKEKASFFTDSRYTIQARNEVNSRDFEIYSITNDQLPTPTLKP